jgi:hypothetical protein
MPAGNKPAPRAVSKEAVIDVAAVQKDFQTTHELALANAQHESAVRAMAERVGYQLDVVDPDLIQRDIAANMRRSVEACMELGRGLCVLKAACGHGNFIARLGVLQMSPDLAQRLMQAAVKFSNTAAPRLLKAVNSQSKLLELLVLDDEQIEEFELLGQSGELDLDDVARMSQKELRAALREAKAENAASEELLGKRDNTIKRLEREVKRFEKLPPDAKVKALQDDATRTMNEAAGSIEGLMRQAFIALDNSGDERHQHDVFLAGLVGQVQAALNQLRAEFILPDVSEAGTQVDDEAWSAVREGMALRAKSGGA